jgi:hypothetical protein
MFEGYKQALAAKPQPYSQWFAHAVEKGQLRGDALKATIQSFFSAPACHQP